VLHHRLRRRPDPRILSLSKDHRRRRKRRRRLPGRVSPVQERHQHQGDDHRRRQPRHSFCTLSSSKGLALSWSKGHRAALLAIGLNRSCWTCTSRRSIPT
jgi:hypothetical protein